MLLLLALLSSASAAPAARPAPAAAAAPAPGWEDTIERVTNAVVAIRVSATRAFDTEGASTSVATGFVVDAERGLILTNRHVVQPGPVVAEAVFADHEEVSLTPVYRDPVHDFGLFRFDPKALQHQQVVALPLHPEEARAGVEIRVVGNDAGEKLSILSGTLARLDREAPVYGKGYNDFNTFYLQAASGTSGGSSGSPVVDVQGRVIGLNAGGRKDAASSFYLPLDRVVRALRLVQAGQPVTRGTWQAVLTYQPFDELRRLGLRDATEDLARAASPDGTGMLVVDEIVPGGPAAGRLRVGDVLVRVNGQLVTTFVPLEALLDDRVGGEVEVEVERGGAPVTVKVPVGDLHAVTPAEFVEVGGSVFHPLSFQMARNYGVPATGVYAVPNGPWLARAGVGDPAVVTAVNGTPVATLDDLEAAFERIPEGAPAQLRYFFLSDPTSTRVATPRMSWRWYPAERCRRAEGVWPCEALTPPTAAWAPPPTRAEPFTPRSAPLKQLASSLVWVRYEAPLRPEGVYGDSFYGTGVVLDAERGLVLTDRDTVPIAAGEVRLVFGGAVEVPAKVVLVHPFHNVAVVQFDPALLGDTPIRAAKFRDEPLDVGDPVWSVGFADITELTAASTAVRDVSLLETALPDPPYFRDSSQAVVELSDPGRAVGGVMADDRGRVTGLLASFVDPSTRPWGALRRGIPTASVLDAVRPLLDGGPLEWRSLGADLGRVSLSQAQVLGLPDDELRLLLGHTGFGRVALQVRRVWAGTPAASVLRGGDVILRVNGKTVTHPREVELATAAPSVSLSVLRDGQVRDVEVGTFAASGEGIRRFVLWGGALLHETPLPVAQQRGRAREGVYVSWIWNGSPAQAYGMWPTRRIIAVDDTPTPDLDAFLAAVASRADRTSVRVRLRGLDDKESVVTLKLDLHYWPTAELRWTGDEWTRTER